MDISDDTLLARVGLLAEQGFQFDLAHRNRITLAA
jgi:hypothetical protein